jgi:transcriptional regulator with XRE-family HTH domain
MLDWKMNPMHGSVRTMNQVVAGNVQRLRRRLGLTQEELRYRLDEQGVRVSRPTVVALEHGKRAIDVSELLALGAALGVAPHLLLYPRADEDVVAADHPDARRFAGAEIADWIWDPDSHELSTAGFSEGTEWHELAGIPMRASAEDYRILSQLVRARERSRDEDGA